jgi:predicted ferric reductase
MTDQLWWYTARAGGTVAWALLALSVLWGLALSTKALGRRLRPNWILDLHRFLGGLALIFTGVHVLAIMADSYVQFGLIEVLVPFTGTWHPAAVAWGIIGFYFLVAVEVTSLLRRRLSKRLWRATHFLSFPLFAMATIHGLTAGTDASAPLLRGGIFIGTLAVATLAIVRTLQATAPPPRPGPRPEPTRAPVQEARTMRRADARIVT